MINDKSRAIAKLKAIITDADTSPSRRIQAANELLARFGATKRALPLVKTIIRTFENFQDASLTKQRAVRTAVEQLESTLALAIKTKDAEEEADQETDPAPAGAAVHEPTENADALREPPLVGGLDLLPDSRDERSWPRLMVALGPSRVLSRDELLASIDIPLWIGECETVDRSPVNLACPSELRHHVTDWELNWETSATWAARGTAEGRALYRADLAQRVHARLNELGISTEAGSFTALADLDADLEGAYYKLEPPFIKFERNQSEPDATPEIQLALTDSGKKRRFINLIRARIRHGFDAYGRKQTSANRSAA